MPADQKKVFVVPSDVCNDENRTENTNAYLIVHSDHSTLVRPDSTYARRMLSRVMLSHKSVFASKLSADDHS